MQADPAKALAPLDLDKQIPKKGDQRQMEPWQRIGTYAAGLALDSAGNHYVSDCCSAGNQVERLDPTGALVQTIGGPGNGPGLFGDQPGGIAVDAQGRMFVTEGPSGTGDRIQVFDADGTFLSSFGSKGTGDGQFGFATSVALDGHGNVYVADAGANRIEKFSLQPPFAP